jgi:hypothetical protein
MMPLQRATAAALACLLAGIVGCSPALFSGRVIVLNGGKKPIKDIVISCPLVPASVWQEIRAVIEPEEGWITDRAKGIPPQLDISWTTSSGGKQHARINFSESDGSFQQSDLLIEFDGRGVPRWRLIEYSGWRNNGP